MKYTLSISLFILLYKQVIAERLSEEEIGGLKQLFKMIDTDNSGTITYDELKHGLKRVGSDLTESEIRALMNAVLVLYSVSLFNSISTIHEIPLVGFVQ